MPAQCLVAVYDSRSEAEQAYRAVLTSGIAEDHLRLCDQQRTAVQAEDQGSIWDWLFGSDVPETDRRRYDDHLASGGTVLSVLMDAPSIANVDQVEELLGRYNPVEMHEEDTRQGLSGQPVSSAGSLGERSRTDAREQVIPLPQEELQVGKTATERVRHIRTYVVEEPVQKDVRLRDERTIVERRPATGAATGKPAERDIEIREVHEQPVVQKSVRGGEELVVRKEASERTERVADTVKKTEVDLGDDAAERPGLKPAKRR